MAETTEIEWARSTLFPQPLSAFQFTNIANTVLLIMFKLVASMAESDAVAYIKTKFWMLSERLDVMGAQIPAFIITAFLTGVIVPNKDRVSPIFVFNPASVVKCSLGFAMFISIMARATHQLFRCADARTDFFLLRSGSRQSASRVGSSFLCLTHFALRLFGVGFSLESRNPSLRGSPILDSATIKAGGILAIKARKILPEGIRTFPLLASCTPLLSIRHLCEVIGDIHSKPFCRSLCGTFCSLRHFNINRDVEMPLYYARNGRGV